MRIVREETLLSCGAFAGSREWQRTRKSLHKAIRGVDWPRGSGSFKIYPEFGKKRGQGNGVVPIKIGLMEELERQGWIREGRVNLKGLGKLDAVLETRHGIVALEWETGNISSSHRALNKMSLGLMKGVLACGILVVPSRNLYRYLTDRVSNMEELEPYLDLWRSVRCKQGILEIVAIEHDGTSMKVPRIPKMTAGRALG